MNRHARIALRASLYRVLASRPGLCKLRRDRAEVDDFLADAQVAGYSLVAAVQVLGASQLDFTCAEAVRMLSRSGRRTAAVLELLSWLDHDRLAAIAYALPEARRPVVYSHGVWAHAVRHAAAGMPAALRAVAELEAVGGVSEPARTFMRDDWSVLTEGAVA